MPTAILPTDRRALESVFGNIEAAIHRNGPTAELLDARNGLAVYMARPKPTRKVRKPKMSRSVELLLKEKFANTSPGNGRGTRFARPDDVNVYMECNGQRIYTNDPAGAKAAREYLKRLRAA
jgi:hypothetical protein